MSLGEQDDRLRAEMKLAYTAAECHAILAEWGREVMGDDALPMALLGSPSDWDEELITQAVLRCGWSYIRFLASDERMTPTIASRVVSLAADYFRSGPRKPAPDKEGYISTRDLHAPWSIGRALEVLAGKGLFHENDEAFIRLLSASRNLKGWKEAKDSFEEITALFSYESKASRAEYLESQRRISSHLDAEAKRQLEDIGEMAPSYSRDINMVLFQYITGTVNVITFQTDRCRISCGWDSSLRENDVLLVVGGSDVAMRIRVESSAECYLLLVKVVSSILRRTEFT